MCFWKVCLTHRTTYSVSDSVSSKGLSADLKRGPSLENSGTAASCSVGDEMEKKMEERIQTKIHVPAYISCLEAAGAAPIFWTVAPGVTSPIARNNLYLY